MKRFKLKYKVSMDGQKILVKNPKSFGVKDERIKKIEQDGSFIYIPVLSEIGKHDGCRTKMRAAYRKGGVQAKCCAVDNKVISFVFDSKKWDKVSALRWAKQKMEVGDD